jgi:hypothetical protein
MRASIAKAGGKTATTFPAVKLLGFSLDILVPSSLTADG